MVLKFDRTSESPAGLFKHRLLDSLSDSGGLAWVPRICIPNKFSGTSDLLIQELTASEYRSSCGIAGMK